MARNYTPVERVERTCECGCGRIFTGRRDRKWATKYCKVKNHLRKKGILKN